MPLYKNIGRGNLVVSKEQIVKPGESVELKKDDADSLPPGTVELAPAKAVEPKKEK